MFNPEQLLGQLLKAGVGGAFGQDRRGGRRGRPGGSLLGALGPGAKAQLGLGLLGVAIAAYDHYSQRGRPALPAASGAATPPPAPGAMPPVPPPPPHGTAAAAVPAAPDPRTQDMVLLIRAMVAAAAADGLIDAEERERILARADDAGLDADTRRFLAAELDAPKSLAAIVAQTRPELAVEVYAASCVAITLDTEAERIYLDTLATRLGIDAPTRETVHAQLGLA